MNKIKFAFTSEKAKEIYNKQPPQYENKLASGFDLKAVDFDNTFDKYGSIHNVEKRNDDLPPSIVSYTLFYSRRILIKTGIKILIPANSEIQIRSRSDLALEQGLTVLNGIGTIDAGYTGEIGVILHNNDFTHYRTIKVGDRIAQGVFNPFERVEFEEMSLFRIF